MFVTLKFDGAAIGAVYSSLGIAAVLMPTLLGIVADKWISAKWVYAACHLVGALTLYLAAQVTTPGDVYQTITSRHPSAESRRYLYKVNSAQKGYRRR